MRWGWLTSLIIIFAFVTQMLVMWPSGSRYCYKDQCGDYYWGVHEHDGIWHMALANAAFDNDNIQMPTYSGERLSGYNWLIDYPLFLLTLVGVPASITYFKILPVIWFVLMIVVWRKFANLYRPNDELYFRWLIFWLFFGSSLSFIFTLWHHGVLIGSSALIAMQPPMMLINLQFAYTLPILGYLLFILGSSKKNLFNELLIGVLLFLAMGLKFYGGAVLLALVVVHSLIFKHWKRILIASIAIISAILVFYQPKVGGGNIMLIKPLATVYPIIEEKSLFYLEKLATARYSDSSVKQVIAGIVALGIFIVFNFGLRMIALLGIKKWNKFEWNIALTIIIAISANALLVQRGEWWNTVQFLYYGFFLAGVLAAKQMTEWFNRSKVLGTIMGVVVVASCIPNAIDTWRVFSVYPPASYISDDEINILSKLALEPSGVVLALPLYASASVEGYSPLPLYQRYESSYVAAYSKKITYLNDRVQARLVGIDYREREGMIANMDCGVLDKVNYIYEAGEQNQVQSWEKCDNKKIKLVESNEYARYYRVN